MDEKDIAIMNLRFAEKLAKHLVEHALESGWTEKVEIPVSINGKFYSVTVSK